MSTSSPLCSTTAAVPSVGCASPRNEPSSAAGPETSTSSTVRSVVDVYPRYAPTPATSANQSTVRAIEARKPSVTMPPATLIPTVTTELVTTVRRGAPFLCVTAAYAKLRSA
ncbi:MAG: hypothetical protein OEV72_05780 [Thermoleophilia bacterium]|nr:hypothetical protein [Thermoleophilia bacterium]